MATKDPPLPPNREQRSDRTPPGSAEIRPFPWEALKSKTDAVRKTEAPADEEEDVDSNTATFLVLGGFILFLVVSGVWLMSAIREAGKLEDCLMQGRRNCISIAQPLER